jgi:hypothetical protein
MRRRLDSKLADLQLIVDSAAGMGRLSPSGEWALVLVARNALPLADGTQAGDDLKELLRDFGAERELPTISPLPEIVLGEDTRLPISFLERGLSAARAVARIMVRRVVGNLPQQGYSYGTGWLLTPDLFLTNHHVIEARDLRFENEATEADFKAQAEGAIAWFGYDDEGKPYFDYKCQKLVHANRRLDYALLRLQPAPQGLAITPPAGMGILEDST